MSFALPLPSPRLEHIKQLWHELQRTRPTSDRYQTLVELIRAETFAHLRAIDVDHGLRPKHETSPASQRLFCRPGTVGRSGRG